jgi:hypothetical protein
LTFLKKYIIIFIEIKKGIDFMAKKKYSEKEIILQEYVEARKELDRATQMFNFATAEFFDIANMELTIAEMRTKVCESKMRLICKSGETNPNFDLFYAVSGLQT